MFFIKKFGKEFCNYSDKITVHLLLNCFHKTAGTRTDCQFKNHRCEFDSCELYCGWFSETRATMCTWIPTNSP